MRTSPPMFLTVLVLVSETIAMGQAAAPLKLEQTIELPDVQGRIDHMSIDVAGHRLLSDWPFHDATQRRHRSAPLRAHVGK